MLSESKSATKPCFFESDGALCEKFLDAGFGSMHGKQLLLSPLEACYLAKIGKASFCSVGADAQIAKQAKKDKGFPFTFAVYSIIRGTGRLVLPAAGSKNYFRVYAPGVGRAEGRPSMLLRLLPGAKPTAGLLKKEVQVAHLERLDLVVATGTAKEPKFHKISAFNF